MERLADVTPGIVGVESDRGVRFFQCRPHVAQLTEGPCQDRMGHGIAWVQVDSGPGRGFRQPRALQVRRTHSARGFRRIVKRQHRMRGGEPRGQCDRLLEERSPAGNIAFPHKPHCAMPGLPGAQAFRRLLHRSLPFGVDDRRIDRPRHRGGDFILDREDALDRAIVTFAPKVVAGFGFDQLDVHADPTFRPAVCCLPARNARQVRVQRVSTSTARPLYVKLELRDITRQRMFPGQIGDDVVGDAVGKEFLFRIRT